MELILSLINAARLPILLIFLMPLVPRDQPDEPAQQQQVDGEDCVGNTFDFDI